MKQNFDDEPETWRLIDSGFQDGFTNMAIDLAMVKAYAGTPTLRLYGWRPPAISIGYHQSLHDIDLQRCREDGIDVVYRPTGGRAILHDQELTYAVVLSRESKLYDARIIPVYERISRAILMGLQQLMLPLQFERAGKTPTAMTPADLTGICFASSIQHEIGYQGKKLIGSAQRRFGDVVLQHGSILLGRAHLKLVDYLAGKSEERKAAIRHYMIGKTVCLNDLTSQPLTYAQLCESLPLGFSKAWGIRFDKTVLSETELEQVEIEKTALRLRSTNV